MAHCYILYSPKLEKYYTGSTELMPKARLELHLSKYYGKTKFTANAEDWQIFLTISCSSINQAKNIEAHIKRMKSNVYIVNLKKYPELIDKLIYKY